MHMTYKPVSLAVGGLHLWGATLVCLATFVAGCAGPSTRLPPPPPATPAQIEKEMQVLQQSFLTDDCMAQLRKSAPELAPADDPGRKAIYAVEFPANPRINPGYSYRLHVTERGRLGYLYTSGGSAGWYTVRGPLPLWSCLHRVLP